MNGRRSGYSSKRISAAVRGNRWMRLRPGWVLLETVMATGLLILGLAVIGAQVQDADASIRRMELELCAMRLAEMKMAELDLGLVELDSVDEEQEEEFGPRFPDFGWRLITEETGLDEMYLLTLEILYLPQSSADFGEYEEGDFDHDLAENIFTIRAMRATPRPLNLEEEFGLDEDEFIEISDKLADLGIPGLDNASALNLTFLAQSDLEDVLAALPILEEVFGIDLQSMAALLPPGLLETLEESGVLEGEEGEEGAGEGS